MGAVIAGHAYAVAKEANLGLVIAVSTPDAGAHWYCCHTDAAPDATQLLFKAEELLPAPEADARNG